MWLDFMFVSVQSRYTDPNQSSLAETDSGQTTKHISWFRPSRRPRSGGARTATCSWGTLQLPRACFIYIYILFSAVKRLIASKISVCVRNISMCAVCIYYVYINTHTCMYILQKNMLYWYIKYKYRHVNTCKYFPNIYMHVCVFIYT